MIGVMESLTKRIGELRAEVEKASERIGLAELEAEQKSLQARMQKPDPAIIFKPP